MGEEAREHDEARGTSARLVRDYIDVVINQRRVDRLDDYVAANYCGHGFHDDREALRSFLTWQASTAPDWHVTVEDVVAEGDRVAVRAIASGIRAERAPGQAHDEPTFRRVEWTTIYRVHSGRIAEAWVVSRDLDSPQPSGGSKAGRQAAAVAESNIAVVERMFEALERLAIEEVNACWSSDARWFILDHNEFGGDYSVADYLEMLGRFFEKYGHGYEFRINEARAHGDLVVLFCHSEQQQLGSTDGLMIYRLRDGLIAEGWTMSRGSDSGLPW